MSKTPAASTFNTKSPLIPVSVATCADAPRVRHSSTDAPEIGRSSGPTTRPLISRTPCSSAVAVGVASSADCGDGNDRFGAQPASNAPTTTKRVRLQVTIDTPGGYQVGKGGGSSHTGKHLTAFPTLQRRTNNQRPRRCVGTPCGLIAQPSSPPHTTAHLHRAPNTSTRRASSSEPAGAPTHRPPKASDHLKPNQPPNTTCPTSPTNPGKQPANNQRPKAMRWGCLRAHSAALKSPAHHKLFLSSTQHRYEASNVI